MKPIIVSGNTRTGKASSVVDMLATYLPVKSKVFNGALPDSITGHDLVIWAPDIPNEQEKNYPVKDKGAVLICSKVIRGDRTEVDAVSRIFDMHGNAVIAIYKDNPKKMRFRLIDALGNTWIDTDKIELLADGITCFYHWSKGQIRMSFVEHADDQLPEDLELPTEFIDLNTKVADKVEGGLGARYFGNFSTRCMKLFPSMRLEDCYLFSPRNVNKRRIGTKDFVLVKPPYYVGDRKYSVDAPCQVQLYQQFDDINLMIHGHAFINPPGFLQSVAETKFYYPCGDLREVEEIAKVFRSGVRIINLKNHGFLLAAEDLEAMSKYVNELEFALHNPLKEDDDVRACRESDMRRGGF